MQLRRALPVLLLLTACGGVSLLDQALPDIPVISSFSANPAALGPDGGATVLSWTVVNEDALSLEPGAGTVTGYTSADLHVAITTTFTLKASNSLGVVAADTTVTVGP